MLGVIGAGREISDLGNTSSAQLEFFLLLPLLDRGRRQGARRKPEGSAPHQHLATPMVMTRAAGAVLLHVTI